MDGYGYGLQTARKRILEYVRTPKTFETAGSGSRQVYNQESRSSPVDPEDVLPILKYPVNYPKLAGPPSGVTAMESVTIYNTYYLCSTKPLPLSSNGSSDDAHPRYYVDVKGCVVALGINRKTKILGGLMSQIIGSTDGVQPSASDSDLTKDLLINFDDDESDARPSTASSSTTSLPGSATPQDVLRHRLNEIMAKPSVERIVNITIHGRTQPYSKSQESRTFQTLTHPSGRFMVRIEVPFKPSEITASIRLYNGDPLTVASVPIGVDKESGISVISDLDDTIRITGVTGDKRQLLRNILLQDHSKAKVEGVDEWFRTLASAGVQFHYVSNSPWQLYRLIDAFLNENKFPQGSIHLKHYSGIINGLTTPSTGKKQATLRKMFKDMPHHQFILIGDSGEADLETYVDMAKEFPHQVLAVYIRDVHNAVESSTHQARSVDSQHSASEEMLIDLSDENETILKVRPPVPRKPVGLRSEKVGESAPGVKTSSNPLPLPPRPSNTSVSINSHQRSIERLPPPLPKRPNTAPIMMPSSQDLNEDIIDRRFDQWESRVARAAASLSPKIIFKVWKHARDIQDESLRLVRRQKN